MSKDTDWIKEAAKGKKNRCVICDTPGVLKRLNELLASIEKAKEAGEPWRVSNVKLGRKLMSDVKDFQYSDSYFRAMYRDHKEFCDD